MAALGSIVKPLAADLAYITAEDKKTLDAEIQDTRALLEAFYKKASPSELSKVLEKQQALDLAARNAAYAAEDLSKLSLKEVLDLIRHRDDAMKLNASKTVATRMKRLNGPELEKFKAFVIENGLRELVDSLASLNYELQEVSLNNIVELASPVVVDVRLRATGGLENIARLVTSPKREIKLQALFLMVNLSHNDNNRDAFRRMTGLVESIVPGLDSADEYIQRVTLKILVNLAVAPKLQDPIAQAGALFKVMQMIKMIKEDRAILIECLKLLQNLSACKTVKTTVRKETLMDLLPYLQPRRLYLEGDKDEPTIQLAVLTFFTNISKFEPNQKVLAEMTFLRTLFLYFMPLSKSAGTTLKFDYPIIICVLECLDVLLQHLNNRILFLDLGGPKLLTAFIEKAMAEFPQPELYTHDAVTVLGTLFRGPGASQIRIQQDQDLVATIVDQVFKVLDANQNGATYVVESCIRCLRDIAIVDESRAVIVLHGDMKLLASCIEKHNIKEIVTHGCELLARLATAQTARAALYTVMPLMTGLIANNDEELRVSIMRSIREVARETAGANLILTIPGSLPNIIDCMEISKEKQNADLHQLALMTLADAIHQAPQEKRDKIRHDLMQAGILYPLLDLFLSPAENIQLIAIALSISLASNEIVREGLIQIGISKRLDAVEQTANYKRAGSSLVTQVKNLRNQLLDRDPSGMARALKQAQEQGAADDPDAVLETLLSKLTQPQLVKLVKEAVSQGADLVPMITKMIQINLAISNARIVQHKNVNPSGRDEDAFTTTGAPRAASAVPPPPKKKNWGAAGSKSKWGGGNSADSKTSVLEAIKTFKDKPYRLRSVDADAEAAARRRAASAAAMSSMPRGAPAGKEVRLLDSGAMQGKRYFAKDMALYIEEASKVFQQVDANLLKIVFDLLESSESVYDYKDAFAKLASKTLSHGEFTDALWKLGFTIRYRREVHADSEEKLATTPPVTIFTQIITPSDVPVKVLLRIIQLTIQKTNRRV